MRRHHLAACAFFVLAGCAVAEQVRAITYPPSFSYMPRSELRSTMWLLASDVVELSRMLTQASTLIVQEEVVARLALMQSHTGALDDHPSNQPKVKKNIGRFERALSAAKLAAEATPPNYFLAGNLTGSCTSCHQDDSPIASNRGTP